MILILLLENLQNRTILIFSRITFSFWKVEEFCPLLPGRKRQDFAEAEFTTHESRSKVIWTFLPSANEVAERWCLVDTPLDRLGRHPQQADTPWADTPWQADTPYDSQTPPPWQAEPPPPGRQTSPLGQTLLLGRHPLGRYPPSRQTPRAGRHPPTSADGYCSGRYAPYWNAFLSFIIVYCFLSVNIYTCRYNMSYV